MATYRKNKWIIEGKLRKYVYHIPQDYSVSGKMFIYLCVLSYRLKAALVRKTGRPEEELCFEERRRSARVGMAEEESIEESCVLERGSRRKAKEEPKKTEVQKLTQQAS